MADVTFPSLPNVVSLLHYDDVARTPDNLHPPAGYPVICVTVSQIEMYCILFHVLQKTEHFSKTWEREIIHDLPGPY